MKSNFTSENVIKWAESKKGLLYVICISLIIKLFLFASESIVNNDGLIYISAAQKFAAGHFKEWLKAFPMPFYPMLIGILHFLIPDWVAAARVLSITLMVFTLIPLYLITKELFSRNAAFWTCLAFAIAPVPNAWADAVIRDPGFIFCLTWAVYFAIQSIDEKRTTLFILSALFSWISVLFRIEGIVLIMYFNLFLLFLTIKTKQERNSLLKGFFLFNIIPLLLIAVFFLGGFSGMITFNRSGEIYEEIRKFFSMGFLDNYQALSEHLKLLVNFSPRPGLNNNFAEIARHYIPVIYLFGLIETFIIVLSPLFIIPLFFGFKEPVRIKHFFIIGLFGVFILLAYYFLIKMDFLTTRYLSIPVLLVYPWAGAGIQRFFQFLSVKYSPKVFAVIFLIFIILPLYQSFEKEFKEDNSIILAGKWLANNPDTNKFRIITCDPRFLFYAGREFMVLNAFSGSRGDAFYSFDIQGNDLNELEQVAITNNYDLLLLRISSKKEAPQFKHFKKIKEFKGRKNISYIFSSPEAEQIIGNKTL
jgi:4-amino-4-deoxy-L-arabinose transferase-like glycosyltransferase